MLLLWLLSRNYKEEVNYILIVIKLIKLDNKFNRPKAATGFISAPVYKTKNYLLAFCRQMFKIFLCSILYITIFVFLSDNIKILPPSIQNIIYEFSVSRIFFKYIVRENPVLCGCYRADKLSEFMRELPILKRSYPTFSLSLVCKDLGVAHNGNPKTNLLLKMIDSGEI